MATGLVQGSIAATRTEEDFALVRDANTRGGLDNVTVVLLQVEDRAEAAPTLAVPHLSGRLDPTLSGASS